MIYGPHMKTLKGDKTRIKGEYYWLKKRNGYVLRKWNGNTLWNPEQQKEYKNNIGKIKEQERQQKLIEQNKKNKNIIIIKNAYGPHQKLPEVKKRIKGTTYINEKGEERYWDGRKLKNKQKEKEYNERPEVKKRKKIKGEERRKDNPDYYREYYQKHKEQINKQNRENYHKNKEERSKKAKELRNRPGQKAIDSERSRVWSQKKRDADPLYRLKGNLRHRLWGALKAKKAKKNNSTLEYHSARVYEIYNHLESQFTDGMNWENMGTKTDGTRGWDIDHRRPCGSFNLKNEDDIYMCFHWSNLQPLWHTENIKKSDKYDPETFEYEWKGREIGWVKKN
tara:strand:- start:2681 stop:3691 length:1011 start_codon:yes stop_codon:yes gene_type:complete